jgi:hypothetical protein
VGRRRGLPGSHADGAAFVAVWIILSAAPQPRSPVPATLPSLLRARARPHFPGHGPSPLTHAVAGPALTDVRVADRPNPLIPRPGNYLRLTRLGDRIDALLFVWWFGNVFEAELPLHPSRRCTTPTEAGRLCPGSLVGFARLAASHADVVRGTTLWVVKSNRPIDCAFKFLTNDT